MAFGWGQTETVNTNALPAIVQAEVCDSAVSLDPDLPWKRYLNELLTNGVTTRSHICFVREFWGDVREQFGVRLPLPLT